jgi:hypothetical protein
MERRGAWEPSHQNHGDVDVSICCRTGKKAIGGGKGECKDGLPGDCGPNSNLRKLHKRSKREKGKNREKRERKRFSKTILKKFCSKTILGWIVLINIRKGEEGLLNHKSKIK